MASRGRAVKYALPYTEKAAALALRMNRDYWRYRKEADTAFNRGELDKASDLADDVEEMGTLYAHIAMALRPRDEHEGLREFIRETRRWANVIWKAHHEAVEALLEQYRRADER
jgi:hypothetical protein